METKIKTEAKNKFAKIEYKKILNAKIILDEARTELNGINTYGIDEIKEGIEILTFKLHQYAKEIRTNLPVDEEEPF